MDLTDIYTNTHNNTVTQLQHSTYHHYNSCNKYNLLKDVWMVVLKSVACPHAKARRDNGPGMQQ